jgi:molybdopterin synthase catalytic subunit
LRGFVRTKEEKTAMSNINRTAQQDSARKLLAGINSNLPAQTTVTLAGTQYTRDTLTASVQQDIDIADAATNARKAFFNAAAMARERLQERKPFYKGLQSYVENMFTDPNVIAEFGFALRKAGTQDTTTKVAAVQKRAATRQARHTMGKNQKAGIKGNVTGVSVTPITEPAAPVVAPTPSVTPASPTPASTVATPAPATANGH